MEEEKPIVFNNDIDLILDQETCHTFNETIPYPGYDVIAIGSNVVTIKSNFPSRGILMSTGGVNDNTSGIDVKTNRQQGCDVIATVAAEFEWQTK